MRLLCYATIQYNHYFMMNMKFTNQIGNAIINIASISLYIRVKVKATDDSFIYNFQMHV